MNPEDITTRVRTSITRLTDLTGTIDEDTARGPSALPGWSRGHVLIHLANFSRAMARQADEALAGRTIEVYDGGRPARDAAIEAGAALPAKDLAQAVTEGTGDLLKAWDQVGPSDWDRPVAYRDGNLLDTAFCAWRELEIHTTDLALAPSIDDWSPIFCLHLLDFLRPRTPDAITLVLQAKDFTWQSGTGEPVALQGALTDLTAWYAGRTPTGPIAGDLPDLNPWP